MMDTFHPPNPALCALHRSLWLAAALVPLVAGCSRHEAVTRDTVPVSKQISPELHGAVSTSSPSAAAAPQRTLGAIILTEDTGWLFKLGGDVTRVESVQEDFVGFVNSVRISDEGSMHLFPPKGWDARPGDDVRLATISVPADGHVLELTVSRVHRDEDTPQDELVRENVNRWREELGLDPIQASELSSETETLKAGTSDVLLVDIVDADGMMDGFASGAAPRRSAGRAGSTEQYPEFPIEFDAPAEWVAEYEKAYGSMVFVALGKGTDLETVNIRISKGGDRRLSNFNLWRGHVDLPPWSAHEMARQIQKIETLGTMGDYAKLVGREQTIMGVIVDAGGDQWFIMLWGRPDLAEREREQFEAFVKSLRLRN